MLYVVNRLYCILRCHWRANRRCPFPDDGPALIVANHRSPVDPMLVWMNHHLAGSRAVYGAFPPGQWRRFAREGWLEDLQVEEVWQHPIYTFRRITRR